LVRRDTPTPATSQPFWKNPTVELGTPAEVRTHLESVEDLADVYHEQRYEAKPEKVLCGLPL
jgi:hypothetical protein